MQTGDRSRTSIGRAEGGKLAPGNPRRSAPGQSPNPGGFDRQARAARSAALAVLTEMLPSPDRAEKMAAALAILNVKPRDSARLVESLNAPLRGAHP